MFTDEASFRQDSTLHATWSRVGHPPEIPVTGERKSIKILGAIELWRARFHYRQDTVFNADTYLGFLEQLARSYRRSGAILIQDNASYHKDAEVWKWGSPQEFVRVAILRGFHDSLDYDEFEVGRGQSFAFSRRYRRFL